MTITPAQVRGARAMIGMLQEELAEAAGVTRKTLATLEAGQTRPHPSTIERMRTVLEKRGIVFFESEEGRGVMLKED
jgi:predicted transcriptional regulator